MAIKAEYIWVDGTSPTKTLRSKTKVIYGQVDSVADFPEWGYDGSSTHQAEGHFSDCVLRPVFYCDDPQRSGESYLVICEVFNADGTPHATNTRAALREIAEKVAAAEPLFGIEQEYTMFQHGRPLGWPETGYPAPQGPFYCGVGADECFGRELADAHLDTCLAAGLVLSGINAEVMPGQWEFQVGPLAPLAVCDQLLVSRYLLYRLGEDFGVAVTLDPKPVRGDWNGAGAHTNYSTKAMREPGGIEAILAVMPAFERRHMAHVEHYGDGIERRLTGKHETNHYKNFKYGVGDRSASIRIPLHVHQAGCGYLEDRRPCANIDPYVVTRLILETTLT